MSAETGRLTVRFLSDWHVGSGNGVPGDVNSTVRRDPDGLPYVPARTVTGILRDAAAVCAAALDGDSASSPSWAEWVAVLFGGNRSDGNGPVPAAVRIRPARYGDEARAAIGRTDQLRAATTFAKPGVRIDPITGRAADDYLRVTEMARTGSVLTAPVTLDWSDWSTEQRDAGALLLALAARLVESLGGKRRRGSGRCAMELSGPGSRPYGELVDWLAARQGRPVDPPTARPVLTQAESTPIGHRAADDGGGWDVVPVTITLHSPVIVPDRLVGNEQRSLDHLPGSMLLPAVLRDLSRTGGTDLGAAARAGDLLITNATPVHGEATTVPVPRSWQHPKNQPATPVNRMVVPFRPGEPQHKAYKKGYVARDGGGPVDPPPMVVRTHNQVDPGTQRPLDGGGGVYAFHAIAPRVPGPEGRPPGEPTVFRAEIRARAGLLPAELSGLGGRGGWALGRSKKDDYGQVSVVAGRRTTRRTEPGAESPVHGPIRVLLTSTMLLRDGRLRPTTDPARLAAELGELLGARLTVAASAGDAGTLDRATAVRRLESWQVRWGLPRPSLVGLAAGSCLTFEADRPIEAARIAEAELRGIGERRAEGFGQLLIDPPELAVGHPAEAGTPAGGSTAGGSTAGAGPTTEPGTTTGPGTTIEPGTPAYEMARLIEREAWRAEIRRRSDEIAADPACRDGVLRLPNRSGKPRSISRSQLAYLRALASDPDQATSWAERTNPKREQLKKWRTEVAALFTDRTAVWDRLGEHGEHGEHGERGGWAAVTATGDGERDLREELRREALEMLVGACLLAHRRDDEERGRR